MKKTLVIALVAALLPVGAAFAQKADRKERMEEFNKHFSEADTNGDGKLTREEAQAKMPKVAEHFDEIDTAKKGYVTKQDIAASLKRMRGARKGKADAES